MPKGLFASGLVARAIDEPFLADMLAQERLDPEGSYFRGVRRVAAGHALVVTPGSARSVRVWRPEAMRELRLSSDDQYLEAFLDVYARAIRDALRARGRVGVMMSGGLDSSSVAAMAASELAERGERLAAFTEVPPQGFAGPIMGHRYVDETPFVERMARRYGNLDLTLIRAGDGFYLDTADARFTAAEAPVRWGLNAAWLERLLETARQQDVRVMLSGWLGNLTVSYAGDAVLPELLGRGRWRAAWREARALGASGRASALRVLTGQGVLPWAPSWLYRGLTGLRRPGGRAGAPWQPCAAIDPAFASAHRVAARARAKGEDGRRRQQPNGRATRTAVIGRAFGTMEGAFAGIQARFGLDLRDPTSGLGMVEFCLSLPEDQFCRGGRRRWLIRRAMADRLPSEILDNPKRGLQTAAWHPYLLQHRSRLTDEVARMGDSDLARRAVDRDKLRRLIDLLPSVDPADRRSFVDYRGALELGLEMGRFIRWAEANR
jgi:asparagine synthase (glutamine-hydrolysing)